MADKHSLTLDTPGRKIKFFRLALDLTQATLANRVGVSQPTLNRWEKDRKIPTPAQQVRLANELGVNRMLLFEEVAA